MFSCNWKDFTCYRFTVHGILWYKYWYFRLFRINSLRYDVILYSIAYFYLFLNVITSVKLNKISVNSTMCDAILLLSDKLFAMSLFSIINVRWGQLIVVLVIFLSYFSGWCVLYTYHLLFFLLLLLLYFSVSWLKLPQS